MKQKKTGKSFSSGATTLIACGTHVKGDIHFSGNLEIEGEVSGNILAAEDTEARVRVLQQGHVRGDVRVPNVVVNGRVEGVIQAQSYVELASNAVVEGDVHYALVEIEKGAQVNGSFVHESAKVLKMEANEEQAEG